MKKVKVSVLTPVFNTNPVHLKECIESILNQSYSDFEFLILNDSPDNTEIRDIVLSYTDKRIKYFENEHNLGISESRNKLISLASGEYLAIFDHDDISGKDRLKSEVMYLDNHPEVGVVSCWARYFGLKNMLFCPPENDMDIKVLLMYNNPIVHSGCMIRKSVLTNNNIFYEKQYSPAEDYRLFTRLIKVTSFHNLPEVLLNYRYHGSMTSEREESGVLKQWYPITMSAQEANPRLWEELKEKCLKEVYWVSLLGIIPVIKISVTPKTKKILLFGIIPILKIKNGRKRMPVNTFFRNE